MCLRGLYNLYSTRQTLSLDRCQGRKNSHVMVQQGSLSENGGQGGKTRENERGIQLCLWDTNGERYSEVFRKCTGFSLTGQTWTIVLDLIYSLRVT